MKKQKLKKALIIIIILILCIFLFKEKPKSNEQEDIIFFKKIYLGKNQENDNNTTQNQEQNEIDNNIEMLNLEKISKKEEYVFDVSYKNTDFKNVNLSETINQETLVNEKIAPGTSGGFEILLKTNQKVKYQIKFKSKNDKPQNLIFKIEGKDRKYKNLEDMEQELQGEIEKNKKITINWNWQYEKDINQDIQDTKDGEKLLEYNFTIYAECIV